MTFVPEVHDNLLSRIVAARAGILAALALVVLWNNPAAAQEAQPRKLSAVEFLRLVRSAHPSRDLTAGQEEAAAAEVTAAGRWENPSLSYEREEVFGGGQRFPENFLRLSLPLEISGRRALRIAGARLGAQATRLGAERKRALLLAAALETYLRASAARLKHEVLTEGRAALSTLFAAIRARAVHGDASGYDRERLGLELEALDDRRLDATRALAGFRRTLALLAGAPRGQIDASDPLGLPNISEARPDPQGDLLGARPDLRAARLHIDQARYDLAAAKRGWVPVLTLWFGLKNAVVDQGQGWGYMAGLSLTLPILDHGQADKQRALARIRIAVAEKRLLDLSSESRVLAARDRLVGSVRQAEHHARTQLPRADRLVKRAVVAYQEGERSLFELLDAHRTARDVRARQIELRLRARLDEVDLRLALGRPLGGNP